MKDDSSSEEGSDEEVALIIRNFRKFIKKKSNWKTYGDGKRRNRKRFCCGCGQTGHFIADCPNEKKKHKHDKDEDIINAHNQNPNAMGFNKSAALKATQQHEGSSQERRRK